MLNFIRVTGCSRIIRAENYRSLCPRGSLERSVPRRGGRLSADGCVLKIITARGMILILVTKILLYFFMHHVHQVHVHAIVNNAQSYWDYIILHIILCLKILLCFNCQFKLMGTAYAVKRVP